MIVLRTLKNKKRRGLTLTELAIVLGAMGLVMGGVWAIVGTVWESYRFRTMNEQTSTVVQNIRNFYSSMGRINAAGTGNAHADGDITAEIDDDSRRLILVDMRENPNVAGGNIHHALSTAAGGSFHVESLLAGRQFRVVLAGLSQGNCIRLLMEFPVMMPEMGVRDVRVNGTAHPVNPNNPSNPGANFPVTLTTAEAWCNIAASNTNEVAFAFAISN